MRVLLLNTDYPKFQHWLYQAHPGLSRSSYDEQMRVRNASLFGVADFYSCNLRALGHEAWDLHANNEVMQRTWAGEQGIDLPREPRRRIRMRRGFVPWLSPVADNESEWFREILLAQVRYYKPDVIFNHDIIKIDRTTVAELKKSGALLVGQSGPVLKDPGREGWSVYDLLLSSFPPTLEWARSLGVPAELFRLGFEHRVLEMIEPAKRSIPVSFVGSFLGVHAPRTSLLEAIARRFPLEVWGTPPQRGFAGSPLEKCWKGEAWGSDMYRVLGQSKIVINHHGDVPPYANNMRLYEATGMGALLITDWKENLGEIFDVGKEVVAYRSAEECLEMVGHYLAHDDERAAIAAAGEARTLRDHTYAKRMEELVEILNRYRPNIGGSR
jgi:hypothetical protein